MLYYVHFHNASLFIISERILRWLYGCLSESLLYVLQEIELQQIMLRELHSLGCKRYDKV